MCEEQGLGPSTTRRQSFFSTRMGKRVRKQELREFRELTIDGEQVAMFGLERVSFLFFPATHVAAGPLAVLWRRTDTGDVSAGSVKHNS